MRLVRVKAPEGQAGEAARIAHEAGAPGVLRGRGLQKFTARA